MAKANLRLSSELKDAFTDAQGSDVRFVKAVIREEAFFPAAVGPASNEIERDCEELVTKHLDANDAAFILFCMDVSVPARRWVLLSFVPESANVRDRMLYSSSRDSLKKQLGADYFTGEFHATSPEEVTLENFQSAKNRQTLDAPLTESERIVKEESRLERDTNVKSTAMGVIPFSITQNAKEKLTLFQEEKFDWIAIRIRSEDESMDVVKSLETLELMDVHSAIDPKNPCFVVYRYRGGLSTGSNDSTLVFLYICPEDAPIKDKMVYSTSKATLLAEAANLGIQFEHHVEINNPMTATEDIRSAIVPPSSEENKPKEFARPSAPSRGRGRGRGPRRPPPDM